MVWLSRDAPIRTCERLKIPEGRRGRGRQKKSLNEVIIQDLKILGLTDDMIKDKRLL